MSVQDNIDLARLLNEYAALDLDGLDHGLYLCHFDVGDCIPLPVDNVSTAGALHNSDGDQTDINAGFTFATHTEPSRPIDSDGFSALGAAI